MKYRYLEKNKTNKKTIFTDDLDWLVIETPDFFFKSNQLYRDLVKHWRKMESKFEGGGDNTILSDNWQSVSNKDSVSRSSTM